MTYKTITFKCPLCNHPNYPFQVTQREFSYPAYCPNGHTVTVPSAPDTLAKKAEKEWTCKDGTNAELTSTYQAQWVKGDWYSFPDGSEGKLVTKQTGVTGFLAC